LDGAGPGVGESLAQSKPLCQLEPCRHDFEADGTATATESMRANAAMEICEPNILVSLVVMDIPGFPHP